MKEAPLTYYNFVNNGKISAKFSYMVLHIVALMNSTVVYSRFTKCSNMLYLGRYQDRDVENRRHNAFSF